MAGFLGNLALAAGRNILYGQEFQKKQADLELEKQQVQMGQMAMQQAQRQQQTQQAVGGFLASEAAKDQSNVTDPAKASQLYQKAAGMALQQGDFVSANTMEELAKGKLNEAKEQAQVVAQQQQVKKEALANAAEDYSANPTADGAKDLMRKAVDAGIPPSQIPQPGTPQWETWKNQQTLAGKTSAQKADYLREVNKANDDRQEKQREFNIREREVQSHNRETAMLRESMIQIDRERLADSRQARADKAEEKAPTTKTIGNATYQYDPSKKLEGARDTADPAWVKLGEKLTSQQIQGVSRGSFAAAEITRSLGTALKFDPGTTTGPFAHLGAKSPMEAMVKVGANALTPAQFQSMNVNAAGLGNQISSLEASLGGRMAAGTQQAHLQDMAVPQPGDSGYTAAYKIANAKELTLTALKHLPGNFKNTEEGKSQIKELEDSVPFSTDDIIKAMKKDPQSKKAEAEIRGLIMSSEKAKENITEAAPLLGATGGGGNTPPPDIQSLVDKYRSK
jgi:hypothetical protein